MRRRSHVSRTRRAQIADEAHQIQALGRTRGRTVDEIQDELLRTFPGELAVGEARMYAEGWTARVVREGLRRLSTEEGLDASGLEDGDVWRWLRGEVRPRDWMLRLCQLFRCHQAQLGWPVQGNETAVDYSPRPATDSLPVPASVVLRHAEWSGMSPIQRRTFLMGGAAMALPTLTLDDLHQIVAAITDARRYFDRAVLNQFRQLITDCATRDGAEGPRGTLQFALGIIGAIDACARDVRPALRRELLGVGAQAAEFAGWLYRDVARPDMAGYWRDRAIEWAQEAGDGAMQGYVLLKKSQAAWDDRDAVRMLTLSQAVQEGPWRLPVKVLAEANQQEARAHAMMGASLDVVERGLDKARSLLAVDGPAPGDRSGVRLSAHYSFPLLAMQSAICYCEVGRPRQAVDIYDAELSERAFTHRDFGYFTSLKAVALAAAGEPDEASRVGLAAFETALSTTSERTIHELVGLVDRLRPWSGHPSVRDLQEAIAQPRHGLTDGATPSRPPSG